MISWHLNFKRRDVRSGGATRRLGAKPHIFARSSNATVTFWMLYTLIVLDHDRRRARLSVFPLRFPALLPAICKFAARAH